MATQTVAATAAATATTAPAATTGMLVSGTVIGISETAYPQ